MLSIDKKKVAQMRYRFSNWFYTPVARGYALMGFLFLAIGISLAIASWQAGNREARQAITSSGQAVAVYGCNRDYHTSTALRGILALSRQRTENSRKRGEISNARARENDEFLNQQLALITRPDCRQAANIISQDPNRKVVVPKPLYDKDAAKRAREREEADEAERLADKVAAKLRARARAKRALERRIKKRIRARLRNR